MKTLRVLVLVDAALLAALGLGMALAHSKPTETDTYERPYEVLADMRLLAAVVCALALAVGGLCLRCTLGELRRLALWLAVANYLIAVATGTLSIAVLWPSKVNILLCSGLILMAAALAAQALRVGSPGKMSPDMAGLGLSEAMRAALLRQISEAAAQEERNRLARELHDSIKQQLFTINVSGAAAQELWEQEPGKAKAAVADVRRSAREAMVEMQALLHELQPHALASAGLVEALREQCEALGFRTGAAVSLELGEAIADDRLPPGAQEAIFRMAREAMANVARHARARNVRVWLGREGDSVRLEVTDDGQGYDAGRRTSGMGIRYLEERAKSVGGTLEITSAPGSGTRVTARVPLVPPPTARSAIATTAFEDWSRIILIAVGAAGWFLTRLGLGKESWIEALNNAMMTSVFLVTGIRWSRVALRAALAPNPPLSAACRYAVHRDSALVFLVATGLTPWRWQLGTIWSWTILWSAVGLVAMGLTWVELGHLHRVSTARRRWPLTRFLASPRTWIPVAVFSGVLGCAVLISWLGPALAGRKAPVPLIAVLGRLTPPEDRLYLLFASVVILYVVSRQPLPEEDSA